MRILILAPQPFFVQRGTPIAVRALIQVLTGLGHTVDAVVFPEGSDPNIPGATLYRVPAIPGTKSVPPGFSVKKLICDAVMLPFAAIRMWRSKYDLVIAVEEAAFMALLLKVLFRVPYIYDMDSSIPEQLSDKYKMPGWLLRLITGAEARAARGAVAAITCCKALQETVEGYAPGLPVQTLEDVTLIEDAGPAPEDCQFDEPVVMYIGNLESYQGVDLLLDGFAEAVKGGAQGRLVIIGGADQHIAALEERARALNVQDKVNLLGPRPVERIGDYLAQASIVVSPRTHGRNTPMKVYSYLDSGRPLLATRLSTHTQVLDDEISMLVEPTTEDMARGITELLNDSSLGERIAAAAGQRVAEEFSPAAYERKLTTFLNAEITPRVASN